MLELGDIMQWGVKSLRARMILLAIFIVNIPIILAGYMMKVSAEQSLLEEKKGKLAMVTQLLDNRLGTDGFSGILNRYGAGEWPREEQIKLLSSQLAVLTDEIATSAPGLGAGFYSLQFDAIITYGPSDQFGYTIGWPIPQDHPGRSVMAHKEYQVQSGTLVRGNILNAMRPLVRDNTVIGYVFANELTDDVKAQLAAMDRGITFSIIVSMIIGMVLILRLTDGFIRDGQRIIDGIRELRYNRQEPITGIKGEMGDIAATINEVARVLEQARQAERLAALGELMAGVAHEIRNPLTGIKGFLQYFQQAGDEAERAMYLPMILHEVDRMNRIIEALLYFARPYRPMTVPADLPKLIQDCFILVGGRAGSNICFEMNVADDIPLVYFDEEQIKQVLLNLLINSVQAIDTQDGVIRVEAMLLPGGTEVELRITDNGPGIPKELQEKIFDPFFTTKPTGTGLGLSIVNRIITAQGGKVTLEQSERGVTIVIALPCMAKEGSHGECQNPDCG